MSPSASSRSAALPVLLPAPTSAACPARPARRRAGRRGHRLTIYGLVLAGHAGRVSTTACPAGGRALVLYAVFAAVERVSRAALMDLRMFTRRPVPAGAFLMLVATALLIGFSFLGSVYLQQQRGYSPLATGLVFLPVAVATGIGARLDRSSSAGPAALRPRWPAWWLRRPERCRWSGSPWTAACTRG